MIRFKRFSKYYPTRNGRSYVFKDVTIDIPTDRSIGVLGPNGAGKSTLIRILGGSDMASSGIIRSDANLSWPLGLQGGLQGSMTGRENTKFVARIHGYRDTREIERKVEAFAEIGNYFDEPTKTYSNGMRARVTFGITMAFDFNFDMLLIDELTAVGDAAFRSKSEKLLKEKYNETKIMMVNHSPPQLARFCDSGIVIMNQQLVFFERLEDAANAYRDTYVKA